ncbi:MAG: ATP-binding cassette domain-containing protein [Clostridia bacterium]|nr:ATP-binding cassette domain-containing protein [Clostridia bacterium]
MIEISNLIKQYGDIHAVNGISFTVEDGEVLGFLGPNGAGKSTTMNILTGFIPYTSGEIRVNGHEIMEEPEAVKKMIGYLPEIPPLYMDMTVKEYLKFAAELKKIAKKDIPGQVAMAMDMLKITDHSHRLIRNLSKGYKQRVGFAQALLGNPEVLVLDEPTVGLDPNQILEIRKIIKKLGQKHTIILSTHIMQEVSAVCDRVVIINKGRIVAIDTPDNLSRHLSGTGSLSITVSGPEKSIIACIRAVEGVRSVRVGADRGENGKVYEVVSDGELDVRKSVSLALGKAGYPVTEMKATDKTLEQIFHELTTGGNK